MYNLGMIKLTLKPRQDGEGQGDRAIAEKEAT